jgi:hypothetical protein
VRGGVDLVEGREDPARIDRDRPRALVGVGEAVGSLYRLLSKATPTNSPARFRIGLPELPPIESWVVRKSTGTSRSSRSFAATSAGGRSKGGLPRTPPRARSTAESGSVNRSAVRSVAADRR